MKQSKKNDANLLIRFLKYFSPYKVHCLGLVILIFINLAFSLIQPILWAKLLTSLFSKSIIQMRNIIICLALLYLSVCFNSLFKCQINKQYTELYFWKSFIYESEIL